ncbi:hypothetical protein EI546_04350 [Aequorivita sp. H23M31]|uniref:Carboxypeptidase regulatory-like domain-containing protein n=1 Tax=Aequorivita ciconiae TaxID=2494375 RepID=A0A410G161_9FLAO|nr:hypothetical protein [Aequorivita sp. H23M31]QAA81006.1 hypothetical protein EI546_04350 [Aequorivita sp. H23M31]
MKNISILLFFFFGIVAFAQIPRNLIDVDISVFLPEKAMLEVNSDILLAGELIQYKIQVIGDKNVKSNLSKVGYVSLRNQNDSVIFNHKLRLKSGKASGDFFLPASLRTGKYFLIGYTNFSRNSPADAFDKKNIYVVNTFMENTGALKARDTVQISGISQNREHLITKNNKTETLKIETDKQVYGLREKVNLTLDSFDKTGGDYVLSVRKINPVQILDQDSKLSQERNPDIFYIPELRGELVSGVVLSTLDNSPIANKEVSLTIPGIDFIFDLAKTDKNGRFFFSIPDDYNSENSLVQVVASNEDTKGYTIVLDKKDFTLENIETAVIKIDPELKSWLQERSVQLQLENAYFEKKQDSIFPRIYHPLFYYDLGTLYLLDDYTRFPTVREIFIEIITLAAIRGSGENTRFFVYNNYDPNGIGKFNNIPPLILMDGMMIQNNLELINYNVRKIKSIRIINEPYRYGPKLFNGIISVETFKGDFRPAPDSNIREIKLPSTVLERKYFNPDYGDKSLVSRIPDYRVQLLWHPRVVISNLVYNTSFYTSDVPGIYEIQLIGFAYTGERISLKDYFEVNGN